MAVAPEQQVIAVRQVAAQCIGRTHKTRKIQTKAPRVHRLPSLFCFDIERLRRHEIVTIGFVPPSRRMPHHQIQERE
jgi:hypothetical protein